jgi:hypothetical protein
VVQVQVSPRRDDPDADAVAGANADPYPTAKDGFEGGEGAGRDRGESWDVSDRDNKGKGRSRGWDGASRSSDRTQAAYLKQFPPVPRDENGDQEVGTFIKLMAANRRLKDAAFQSRGVSMGQVADR